MSDEFENREQELGELSEKLLRERGELQYFSPDYQESPKRVYDQPAQGKPGTLPVKYKVASIYDTRPVNSQEFWVSTNDVAIVSTGNPTSLSWTVPDGYVAVIRAIRWQHIAASINPPSNFYAIPDFKVTTAPVYMQVLVNGGMKSAFNANGNSSLQGWGSDWQDTHVIAGPGELIEIKTSTTFEFAFTYCHSEIKGQLLLSRGYAKQFEIANIDEVDRSKAVMRPGKSPYDASKRR